jgi:hypothetical protein
MGILKKSFEVSKRKQEMLEGKHDKGQLYFMLVLVIISLFARTGVDFRIRIVVGISVTAMVIYKSIKK